jgi:hypothetical protein
MADPSSGARPGGGSYFSQSASSPDFDMGLLQSLYDTVGRPDGWNTFIDALTRCYGGAIGVLLVHDTATRNGFAQASAQIERDQVDAYKRYYASVNPWIPQLERRPIGVAAPAEFSLPRADLLKTEFYSDFLRPNGLCSGVGLTVQKNESRHMVVSVLFPQATAERDDDAVGRLQRLAPHLLRAAQLSRHLAAMEARVTAAETALDALETAMLLVDRAGRVVHMNSAADRVVTMGDGLTITRSVLCAVYPGDNRTLWHLVNAALEAQRNVAVAPGGVMRVARRSGRTPY